jgi:MoxR-like ATPase
MGEATSLSEAADALGREENVFFSKRFLLPRPLLKALMSERPVVLLIDEIDRADAEFEAFLLEILSDFQISVPELGTIRANHQPMVVLTSNNTRELSEALKRRALYLFVDYPTFDSELRIVQMRAPNLAPAVAKQCVEIVQRLRGLDLKKSPSVAETVDWAKALVAINAKHLDEKTLNDTLTVILKHESDIQRARRALSGGKGARDFGMR